MWGIPGFNLTYINTLYHPINAVSKINFNAWMSVCLPSGCYGAKPREQKLPCSEFPALCFPSRRAIPSWLCLKMRCVRHQRCLPAVNIPSLLLSGSHTHDSFTFWICEFASCKTIDCFAPSTHAGNMMFPQETWTMLDKVFRPPTPTAPTCSLHCMGGIPRFTVSATSSTFFHLWVNPLF